VSKAVRNGENEIEITLGGGWWDIAQPELFGFERAPWNAPPKMLLRLNIEFSDGSRQVVVSDDSWKQAIGQITYNDVRAGRRWITRALRRSGKM
jgi:alpha-L-rhamnosidase